MKQILFLLAFFNTFVYADSLDFPPITTPVTVSNGGTGTNTLTGIIKGSGTSAFTAVTAPSGAIVGTTDTQTLTGKTYDTAGSGNVFKINGTTLSAVTGTGSTVVTDTNPILSGGAVIGLQIGKTASTTLGDATTYLGIGKLDQGANTLRLIGYGYKNTYYPAYSGYIETSNTSFTQGDLTFYTRNATTDTAPSEAARITHTGALLLNTTTDDGSNKLQINGSSTVNNQYFITGNNGTTNPGSTGNGSAGSSTTNGYLITGNGSTNDISLLNKSGSNALRVPTGTTNVVVAGTLTATTGINITNSLCSSTAPTVTGFGTSPSVPNNNGTCAFTVNVGTGGVASTGTVTLPAATTGWVCHAADVTTPASFVTYQTGGTTTTATFTNYSRTTGAAIAWTASDILRISCMGY